MKQEYEIEKTGQLILTFDKYKQLLVDFKQKQK